MKITGKKGEGTRVEVVLPAERGRKMWKVMAADDEAYMQQALEKLIPWERLGVPCGGSRLTVRSW